MKEQLLTQIYNFDDGIEDFIKYVVEHYSYIENCGTDDEVIHKKFYPITSRK